VETAERVQHDPEARERLRQVIAQDVRRLDRLITDISNASRLEAQIAREGDARVDLARLITDIAASYEGQPGAPVTVQSDGERIAARPIRGLQGPIGQVFRNLIDNARSFSPDGGSVRVSFHAGGEGLRDGADAITVRVDDDGPGIPADKLEKIFDRFYSDRPAGSAFGNNSGLGLSIARQIVEAHGGAIHAENRIHPDGTRAGARFVVRFPLA
jgi:two-component system sensor histidine kinase ChvG